MEAREMSDAMLAKNSDKLFICGLHILKDYQGGARFPQDFALRQEQDL
jgi:hypothetical protein